ncbi:MAG: hypothetical protein ABI742_13410, partial [Gemmatimonadota bacterium]
MRVLYGVFQTGAQANGGVESFTQLLETRGGNGATVITQMQTPVNDRWQRSGARVETWSIPYAMGQSMRAAGPLAAVARARSIAATNSRVAWVVQSEGTSIVHCNDISALWHLGPGGRLGRAALIHHVRDVKPEGEDYGARWQVAVRLAGHTVVLSEDMRLRLVDRLGLSSGLAARISVL